MGQKQTHFNLYFSKPLLTRLSKNDSKLITNFMN